MATVDSLEEQVRNSASRVTQRAILLYRLRALMLVIGLAALATLSFVGLDYSLRVEERGWRWLLSLLWLATLVGIAWRYLPDARTFRLTPIQVARWIERRHPEIGDSLSRLLSVGQLPGSDARYGSLELRQAARQCDHSLANLPWRDFVDARPTIQATAFCGLMVAVVGCAFLVAGSIAQTGLSRIVAPWSWTPWPRHEQLQLVDAPATIARDSELEVKVIDLNPPLPAVIEIEVRVNDEQSGKTNLMRLPMRNLTDLAVVTLPAMQSDFAMRPVGGDYDNGPWHKVQVARQPQLREYAFHVEPPEYTRQPASELVGQRIDVLSGSRVTLRGKFDEPLKMLRAVAVTDQSSEPPTTSSQRTDVVAWSAVLAADGLSFELFPPSDEAAMMVEDRKWRLELETVEELSLRDTKLWAIHVLTDRPPGVTMAPIEPHIITRSANLTVTGIASDDLGLADAQLSWRLANQEAQTTQLWNSANDSSSSQAAKRSVDLTTNWSGTAAGLNVGQSVTLELVARDTAGQIGRSAPQTFEVVDDATALAQLQSQQAATFGPLRQLLDAQERNQQSLNRTLEIGKQLESLDSEQTQSVGTAAQVEHNIAANLAGNQDSLAERLEQLSQQMDRNQLNDSPLARDVSKLQAGIEALVKDQLEPSIKELEAAHQALRNSASSANAKSAVQQLAKAVQNHQQATDKFSKLVDSLAVSESLADVQKVVQELAAEQAAIAKATERLQVDAVVKGNSAQLDAERIGVESDQQELARRVDELATALEHETSQAQSPDGKEDSARSQIEAAREQLLRKRIGDKMRQAAEQVHRSQWTEASETQQEARRLIDQVAATLGGGTSASEGSRQSIEQQILDLHALLATAIQRHEPVVTELDRLNATQSKSPSDDMPRPNAKQLEDWLRTERQVQQLLSQSGQRLPSLQAFDWLLDQCDTELLREIALLERQRTGPDVVASARAALDMMKIAQTAVAQAAFNENSPSESNADGGEQQPTQAEDNQSQLPVLASLRLLRDMQALINTQSEQLLSGSATVDNSALERMADRQQALAEQVATLREQIQQTQSGPADQQAPRP